MKTLTALLLLIWLPMPSVTDDDRHIEGAWLQDGVKWTKAPAGMNPRLKLGEAEILYFRKDQAFAIIYCIVNRIPKEYETISHGDGQAVYRGKWEAQGDDIAVEYRLVDRTVKIKGEALPGTIQHATIKASRGILHLEKGSFHRAADLDNDAAEVVGGLPQSSRITEGQRANIARKREGATLTMRLDTLTMR